MTTALKARLQEAMKAAMRAKESRRLTVIRLMLAAIKQYEVDERKEAVDSVVLQQLEKMLKQRRDAIEIYQQAGKTELADQESFEQQVIQEFMPQPLSHAEVETLIQQAIEETQAKTPQEMGKVIAWLKPQLTGRADMGMVSSKIKQQLGG